MNHIIAMKISYSAWNLPEIVTGQILRKVGFLPDLFKQASIGSEFQQQVDLTLVIEESIHF